MANVVAVPARYEDVTAQWLSDALQQAWPGVRVADVRRGAPFGYKQNKFHLSVDYANGGADMPDRFIVKGNFPGQDDPATGSAWAMKSELLSLRDVVPLVAAPQGPAWRHIGVGDDASVIVMDDIGGTGAVFFDTFRTLDLGQAMAFTDAFARMHASSWNSPMFDAGRAMGPGTMAAENRHMVNQVYFPTFFDQAQWESFVALPRGRVLPRCLQDMARSRAGWEAMWKLLGQSAMVVIHGDEHLGNLYVDGQGRPGVIDWVARPEHWPVGLSYFLLCALDIADRRMWERPLLAHYLTRLAAYGVRDVPSMEEAWFLYRCATLFPMMTWLNNSAVWQPEAVNTANVARSVVAALDHDALRLLGV